MAEEFIKQQHKNSWYDGWFYSRFIDKLGGEKFNRAILKMLPEDSVVIDIGCGIGSLVSILSRKCKNVVGVDTSPRMIEFARKKGQREGNDRIEFRLIGKNSNLKDIFSQKFDYAISKMVLHENSSSVRSHIINNIKEISSKAIIADWVYPLPAGFAGFASNTIEFIAGKEHYRNFREWCSAGGLMGFLDREGLKVIEEKEYKNKTGKIVKVQW